MGGKAGGNKEVRHRPQKPDQPPLQPGDASAGGDIKTIVERVGQLLKILLSLYKVPLPLADDDNEEDLEGIENNNPPASAGPQDDNLVNDGSTLLTLPLTNKSGD